MIVIHHSFTYIYVRYNCLLMVNIGRQHIVVDNGILNIQHVLFSVNVPFVTFINTVIIYTCQRSIVALI